MDGRGMALWRICVKVGIPSLAFKQTTWIRGAAGFAILLMPDAMDTTLAMASLEYWGLLIAQANCATRSIGNACVSFLGLEPSTLAFGNKTQDSHAGSARSRLIVGYRYSEISSCYVDTRPQHGIAPFQGEDFLEDMPLQTEEALQIVWKLSSSMAFQVQLQYLFSVHNGMPRIGSKFSRIFWCLGKGCEVES